MKATLTTLHHQHNDWLRELAFYKDEMAILLNRLSEVAEANTSKEVFAQVEHFQNRYILLNEEIDILGHDVRESKQAIEDKAAALPETVNLRIVDSNEQLLARVQYLSKSFSETRFEFNTFLSRTL